MTERNENTLCKDLLYIHACIYVISIHIHERLWSAEGDFNGLQQEEKN